MENYFWVAVQTHFYEGRVVDDKYEAARHVEAMDVLALAGPSRLRVDSINLRCVMKAIMARAFELSLAVERQNIRRKRGKWADIAAELIDNDIPVPCQIRPCPVFTEERLGEFAVAYMQLSERTPIDVSCCSAQVVETLQWALADLDSPTTAFGRACGGRRYALIGAAVCKRQETEPIPTNIWERIITLLHSFGIDNLTDRLHRAALFVWDFVECAVHTGLSSGMVAEPRTDLCYSSGCNCLKGLEARTPPETFLFEDSVHSWWTSKTQSTPNANLTKLNCFKLRVTTEEKASFPTLEELKLNAVKAFSHFEPYRYYIREYLSERGLDEEAINKLDAINLQTAMLAYNENFPQKYGGVAKMLLSPEDPDDLMPLFLRPNELRCKTFWKILTASHIKCQMGKPSGWVRLDYMTATPRDANSEDVYQRIPCRLRSISAIDDPRLSLVECEKHEAPKTASKDKIIANLNPTVLDAYSGAVFDLISGR